MSIGLLKTELNFHIEGILYLCFMSYSTYVSLMMTALLSAKNFVVSTTSYVVITQ